MDVEISFIQMNDRWQPLENAIKYPLSSHFKMKDLEQREFLSILFPLLHLIGVWQFIDYFFVRVQVPELGL